MRSIKHNLVFSLLVALLCTAAFTGSSQSQEQAIRACYTNYLAAKKNHDGNAIAALVSKESINHYGVILDCALNCSEVMTHALDPWMKMTVLQARLQFTPSELRKQTPQTFFAFMVGKGELGVENQARPDLQNLGEITVAGNKAKALVLLDGTIVKVNGEPATFDFVKEGGIWKVDLVGIIAQMEKTLAVISSRKQETEDQKEQTMLEILQQRLGRDVSQDIWKPINPK